MYATFLHTDKTLTQVFCFWLVGWLVLLVLLLLFVSLFLSFFCVLSFFLSFLSAILQICSTNNKHSKTQHSKNAIQITVEK